MCTVCPPHPIVQVSQNGTRLHVSAYAPLFHVPLPQNAQLVAVQTCDSRCPFYLAYQISSWILLWIMLKVYARCLSTFPRQPSRHHPCPLDVSPLSQPLLPLFYNLQRPATSSSVVAVLGGMLSSLRVSSLAYTLCEPRKSSNCNLLAKTLQWLRIRCLVCFAICVG
ncbi:hypothetical protein P691DRAFT_806330 [Macrolepiota fuliginosa MF-IS2]|uniref:Uncharacterized protein n=1 Tax=Macrolepiota fuliginosa MF-IS2 TaxID=1400762 RepID=A0A9P5X8D9_9AGAR|nr:hypothetical protein P691DRAFT_806330 [Macrolepiota fuliginosa MF-IS2]